MNNNLKDYNFYQLVELLYRSEGQDIEHPGNQSPENERIRYFASASLGFPAGDIVSVTKQEYGYDGFVE